MLDDASRRRQAAGKRALSRYQDELIQYRAQAQTVRVKRDRARAEHRWGVWRNYRKIPSQNPMASKLQMRSYAHPPTAPLDG